MLIGNVSDERYVAIPDVLIEINGTQLKEPTIVRSTPRGAVYADVPPGTYEITLAKDGFGSKSVQVEVGDSEPYQFRLLSDTLLGYMWPKWVKSGVHSEFRVHAVEQYQLSLWRYGWKKEFVQTIGWYDEHGPRANMQITPDGDYTQTGVQWNKQGYGSTQHTQFVTAPERSGLYYLHAKTFSGGFFAFPWIIAPRKPEARIAVLASTNCWNAYNNFGGRSNYVNADKLPSVPIVNARLDLDRYRNPDSFGTWLPRDSEYRRLSFERPDLGSHVPEPDQVTDPIVGRMGGNQGPGEWRLLGWLERESFDYDLYSEAQLHFGELPLDAYDVLILSVHPEYWTRDMFTQVKRWVYEKGGNLVYLGGNGLNCEVTLSSDGTMRCLSHLYSRSGSMGGDIDDPRRALESRMHRTFEPEAGLLGVTTTVSGIMTAAPYRVLDASHWIFRETGLKNGDLFGEKTLLERVPGGASGHETDKRSPSSPVGTLLLAKGTNPGDGGAEMVYFQTSSGGHVFSCGSITWVFALLIDPLVSKITSNVLSQFRR